MAAKLRITAVILLLSAGCATKTVLPTPMNKSVRQPSAEEYTSLADEVESHLMRDVARAWFPRCVDEQNGGFHANFSRDWTKQPGSGKFIVFQSRQTWISSQLAMHRPGLRAEFLRYARHGLKYLNEVMWDGEFGGFYWGLDNEGKPTDAFGSDKYLYGESFGMYAAAAAYQATGEAAGLDLAKRAFRWLEEHAHDGKHGGYFEIMTRQGKVIELPGPITPRSGKYAAGGFYAGYKSMNSHIHMLEALSALYEVWKDGEVRERLEEVLRIVRDRVAVEPGCLNLFFTRDWRPVPDHDSYGHDIETAFLLIEAAESLGEGIDGKTLGMARMLVDHALDWGWDEQHGGFYDKGFALSAAFDKKKVWWSQVEGLNALLLMHEQFGVESDRYWQAFVKQWQFVRRFQIDSEFGGLYGEVEADGAPISTTKGQNWKAGYHDGRSFMLVADRLRGLSTASVKAGR